MHALLIALCLFRPAVVLPDVSQEVLAPFDIKGLGLGTKVTLVLAMSTDCRTCVDSIGFYKGLSASNRTA
jgi:hypothetical protein